MKISVKMKINHYCIIYLFRIKYKDNEIVKIGEESFEFDDNNKCVIINNIPDYYIPITSTDNKDSTYIRFEILKNEKTIKCCLTMPIIKLYPFERNKEYTLQMTGRGSNPSKPSILNIYL